MDGYAHVFLIARVAVDLPSLPFTRPAAVKRPSRSSP
jgi:hypothetical protein